VNLVELLDRVQFEEDHFWDLKETPPPVEPEAGSSEDDLKPWAPFPTPFAILRESSRHV